MAKRYNREKRAKYGQNYIKNPALVRRLLKKLELKSDDTVFEIGPGEGIFTAELLKIVKRVVAVEIDAENIASLKEKFTQELKKERLILVHADALGFDKKLELKKLGVKDYKIVASIPYNISSKIFKKYLLKKPFPQEACFVVQKEFAGRIMKKGELLSALLQSFYKIEILYEFKREDFSPKPSVDSVLVGLTLKKDLPQGVLEKLGNYKDFVSAAYSQPIKSVQAFLKSFINPDKMQSLLDKRKIKRKEKVTELGSSDFITLFDFIQKQSKT